MRLLVTGATGFVGARLALAAAGRGIDVLGTGRAVDSEGGRALQAAGIDLRSGDITDPQFAARITAGVTHVCHLAAAWREASLPAEHFQRVNVEGSLTLARAADRNGVGTFVFCSTIGLHARSASQPVVETSPLDLTNAYEQSKADAEAALRELARTVAMRVVILRPADAYGPGDLRLLKLFRTVSKGRFPLAGDGQGQRHMLYIDDLVDAFLAACEAQVPTGEALIIAGPETTRLDALLARISRLTGARRYGFRVPFGLFKFAAGVVEDGCRLAGKDPPLHRRTLDFYRTNVTYDTSKAKRLLGWSPRVGLEQGLSQTLDWYRARRLM